MPATRPPSCRIVSGPRGISPFRLSRTSSVMTVEIRGGGADQVGVGDGNDRGGERGGCPRQRDEGGEDPRTAAVPQHACSHSGARTIPGVERRESDDSVQWTTGKSPTWDQAAAARYSR